VGFKRRDGDGEGRDGGAGAKVSARPARAAATGADRRKHVRVPREVEMTLETKDGAEFDARSLDVSEGGMFVTGDFFIPACTVVQVKPSSAGVPTTTATVVRARDRGGDFAMGLWFDGADNDNDDGSNKK
jgi:hypothetical protein